MSIIINSWKINWVYKFYKDLKIYKINKHFCIIYNHWYAFWNKISIKSYINKDKIDFSEKSLLKIINFYEVMNDIDSWNWDYWESKYKTERLSILSNLEQLTESWSQMQEYVWWIWLEEEENKILFWWQRSWAWFGKFDRDNPMLWQWFCKDNNTWKIVDKSEFSREWDYLCYDYLTIQEYYLLIQLYLWLYNKDKYKKELEENQKNWKYDNIEKYKIAFNELKKHLEYKKKIELEKYKDVNYPKKYEYIKMVDEIPVTQYLWKENWEIYNKVNETLIEYFELQLMQKDISWAFDWINIEKIYDIDWSDKENMKHVEEIKDEFWEEVVIDQ